MSPFAHHVVAAAGHASSSSGGQAVTFWVLAVLSVVAALGMVAARKAVHCAMLLAVVMLSLAVLYATQGAPFLAFVQVIVYTGAVLMLFLFVVMLVGVSAVDSVVETIKGQRLAAGLAGIALIVLLLGIVGRTTLGGITHAGPKYGSANLTSLATLIFTRYVYAFEVTSALLITAALGAMVLAHRERTTPKLTQRDLAKRRLKSGYLAPLPGPGTYAQHNAVDRPALLPDGRPSELSVSPVIAGRRGPGTEGPMLPAVAQGQRTGPDQPVPGDAAPSETAPADEEGSS
ncbi:MAG: NADH-quinone oxidoreductase subunit J [Micromonosporaceae bacterium]